MRLAATLMAATRPEYLRPVLTSWQPALRPGWMWSARVEPTVPEVAEIVEQSWIPDVRLNGEVLGVHDNPWWSMEAGFEQADFTVLVEDDVVVAPDILEFYAWAARTYQHDPSVMAVCAFTRQGRPPPEGLHRGVELVRGFSPIGWGTWVDRWDQSLRDTWDHDNSSGTHPLTGWDWNINVNVRAGRSVVMPLASRTQHIGKHGVHCTGDLFPTTLADYFAGDHPETMEGEWHACGSR